MGWPVFDYGICGVGGSVTIAVIIARGCGSWGGSCSGSGGANSCRRRQRRSSDGRLNQLNGWMLLAGVGTVRDDYGRLNGAFF